MRTITTTVAILVALTTTAAADTPERVTWSARAAMTERFMDSRSAMTLTDGHLDGFGLSIDRRLVTLHLPGPFPVLDVAAELGFGRGSADGTTFDQLTNDISTWEITGGARARLPILSWLHLQARAALGGGRTSTTIASTYMTDVAIYDRDSIAVASTGIGLALLPRLTSKDRSGFWWGVEAELGYHTSTATEITATPRDRQPEELTIPAVYASLGDLDLDGTTFTIALTAGF
jgi:hypothetical protein